MTTNKPERQQPIRHDWDYQDKCRRCGDRDWYASATCTPKRQPAEQQPDNRADVRLDKQCRKDVAAALGFIGGGNYAWSYLLQQIKDITSAEGKQPAPDVAGLVGLLEHAQCSNCDGSGARYDNYGEPEQCQWCHERDAALAAHRKGGSDDE